jgi:hypothetical protein
MLTMTPRAAYPFRCGVHHSRHMLKLLRVCMGHRWSGVLLVVQHAADVVPVWQGHTHWKVTPRTLPHCPTTAAALLLQLRADAAPAGGSSCMLPVLTQRRDSAGGVCGSCVA